MNGKPGNRKAEQTKGERPAISASEIEKITAHPCAERATQTEADLKKPEDEADLAAGKDVGNHRAVGRIAGGVANGIKHRGKINEPDGRSPGNCDEAAQSRWSQQNRHCIGMVSSKLVGDQSPDNRAADSDESDQSGDKGSQQLVKP